jgi:hypothetical protein
MLKLPALAFLATFSLPLSGQTEGVSENPVLRKVQYEKDLSDAYSRIDPAIDGWNTEVRGDQYSQQLKDITAALLGKITSGSLAPDFSGHEIRPSSLTIHFENAGLSVKRGTSSAQKLPFAKITPTWPSKLKTKIKVTRISPGGCHALLTFKSPLLQINTTWNCTWTDSDPPLLKSLEVLDYEEVEQKGTRLFSDVTASVLGELPAYHDQLLRSTDHWRLRLPRDFGLDPAANHGLALGDVNGDGLEDLYLCQQGGLPNRLFLQNPDGTMRDFSAESRTNWMDYCAAALFIDLDNDGDQDLVVSQDFKILFMENTDGQGHFELVFGNSTKAQSFSLSSADFDQDGFLDVYICGYNPSRSEARAGALGEPVPFHDANNGGQNILWRNLGNWNFEDITEEVGLDQNNTRFSFAASWEDYDQDGDPDLYVANDFGRNCLYQNQGAAEGKLPFFVNIAAALGVEDSSAGMSTNWGDFNRDGWMDLYVSNMFSSAGNRITYQKQFKTGADPETLGTFQRMARGNSLFAANGKGGFQDVSETTHTTMARWCWGSTFADINNDGWSDILAANGFITAEDTGDL